MARATKKVKYLCLNGPYGGKVLLLTTPSTYSFSASGFTGRYVAGRLKKRTVGCHPLDHARLSDEDKENPLFITIGPEDKNGMATRTELIWQLEDGTTPCDPPPPPPTPRTYEVGEKVKILKCIGEAPSGEHPGGTFAYENDIVMIRRHSFAPNHYAVSHLDRTDGLMFCVKWDEIDHWEGIKVVDPAREIRGKDAWDQA